MQVISLTTNAFSPTFFHITVRSQPGFWYTTQPEFYSFLFDVQHSALKYLAKWLIDILAHPQRLSPPKYKGGIFQFSLPTLWIFMLFGHWFLSLSFFARPRIFRRVARAQQTPVSPSFFVLYKAYNWLKILSIFQNNTSFPFERLFLDWCLF